ncbi:OsmC family protein [Acetobacter orleanensis]|uniref:Osmotically inducible protein C n=1 Tax=Acetobacter orleanensis TaxID=104099 RepID=A0A4Y3TQL4_9PROT|nr:OsmC family protein [Acetobacter orleanensis]PCD78275.1 osmotically inducible protein C [Acetobacter orleanensis]GAN69204.1 osmotically inducible peroxiredoxin OsmC [Acetobacter orleanensis JCM 7639]GBR29302.1 OsmC-like protein [Acetobacter orleanensis NRIC 0473]GEB84064.1 hypothetical protein AOR01nite_25410 [Acetobacter orleanensis]
MATFPGGHVNYKRDFTILADEPLELLGDNTAPNPQELLMAALNACLTVGYIVNTSIRNVEIYKFEIETTGKLDIRGFLGIDRNINHGYDEVQYIVCISSNGSNDQIEEIHQAVLKTSPNYANFFRSIHMNGKIEINR